MHGLPVMPPRLLDDQDHADLRFFQDASLELSGARRKHGPISSAHEGYAVLLEEVEEFWELVRRQTGDRDPREVYRELVQIAAMAARIATDLELMKK